MWRVELPLLRRLLWLSCACGALVVAGCGERLVPVSGKVTLGGKPLTGGTVSYIPDTSKGNNTKGGPSGTLDADGNYRLTTEGRNGAPLGWYKVTVMIMMLPTGTEAMKPMSPGGGPPPLASGGVNPKYSNATTTPLAVEVVAAPQPGAYDLKLEK